MSELADAAGIARGTIYNTVASVDSLFEDAHDGPTWGRFINRFALSSPSLQALWSGQLLATRELPPLLEAGVSA